ncbi:TPA: hypothetical protein DCF80_00555 [Candidatus Saccharibacteria bacterium]|nr:hypothetical protein [Candidatus Saccharibacteria bacterium]HRK40901.1 hypothetical protein [Candidatus Saccharibacteria bacterium]
MVKSTPVDPWVATVEVDSEGAATELRQIAHEHLAMRGQPVSGTNPLPTDIHVSIACAISIVLDKRPVVLSGAEVMMQVKVKMPRVQLTSEDKLVVLKELRDAVRRAKVKARKPTVIRK